VQTTCCWCGRVLEFVKIHGAQVWVCRRETCFGRCWRYQISAQGARADGQPGLGRSRLLFLPLPRQAEIWEAVERGGARVRAWDEGGRVGTPPVVRVLFGGAAGGSKSHGIRWWHYYRALTEPRYKGLILRRTFPELEKNHIRKAIAEVEGFGAEYVHSGKEGSRLIRFPANGSIIEFGHCEDKSAVANYLGAEYDGISFDELVTFESQMATMISSRARTTVAGRIPAVVSGTNPGGPEAGWVRDYYIDRTVDLAEFPTYRAEDYQFIPSKLEDNPYLDAGYEATLLALPPMLRKAYREGSWDVWPGQYFPEFSRDRHICEEAGFRPRDLKCYIGLDWGYVSPGCAMFLAVLPDRRVYVFDEYTFKGTTVGVVADQIRRKCAEWGIRPTVMADNQMWGASNETGETMAETCMRRGLLMRQATKDRINGWQRFRAFLSDAPDGKPWMTVHPRCTQLVRTIPALQQDGANPEDVDSDGPDHWAEAVRYVLFARPMPGVESQRVSLPPPGSIGEMLRRSKPATGILGLRTS
jgi:phage terminase large subunit